MPLRMAGTPFQHLVWEGLRAIPYGETVSYAELARRIGRPGASRAVGSANGRNRFSIVVPCHRVIAADGTLGGYGGGLDRKEWLLQHEAAVLQARTRTDAACTAMLRRISRSIELTSPARPCPLHVPRKKGESPDARRRDGLGFTASLAPACRFPGRSGSRSGRRSQGWTGPPGRRGTARNSQIAVGRARDSRC